MYKGFFGTTKMAIRRSVLNRILPVPEELVIEADEYIFMLAPALAPAYLLDEALFFYRFHGGNLFQTDSFDEVRVRRKGRVLAALVTHLPPRLAEFGVSREATDALLQSLRMDSARTRLSLDGGSSWETFQVERAQYKINYQRMTLGYHAFRAFALLTALILPPRWFYRFRRWYTGSGLAKARARVAHATPPESVVEIRPEN